MQSHDGSKKTSPPTPSASGALKSAPRTRPASELWDLLATTPLIPATDSRERDAERAAQNALRPGTPPLSSTLPSGPPDALAPDDRALFEARLSADLSAVRLHTDARAAQAAEARQARAFAVGSHVVFGPGEYQPSTHEGRHLLAHELAHVAQHQAAAATPAVHRQPKPDAGAKKKGVDPAFWEWWKKITGFEGSLEDWKSRPQNKADRGGETNWGVTKQMYMANAKALGLPPTEEGFAAMTPDQAMLFGQMIWKASGAAKVKNTGVALVMADWYWGGIDLGRFSKLLESKGRKATFNQGRPDQATIDFLNTLPPDELAELMSDAKAAQYKRIAEKDKSQAQFLEGWLKRNEERREQAREFTKPAPAAAPASPGAKPAAAKQADPVARADAALDAARAKAAALAPPAQPAPSLLPGPGPQPAPAPALGPFPVGASDAERASAVAGIFEGEKALLVAQADKLSTMAASGGTGTPTYRKMHAAFAAMRDPWPGQLRSAISIFEKEDQAKYGTVIQRLRALAAWLSQGGQERLFSVQVPP